MIRPTNTKERLLDAAERLFAEQGYAGASLRSITAEAGVNLAAVNYHFRSKEALLRAVFARRIGALNQKRLEMLDACEAASGGAPSLEAVLEAFFAPALRLSEEDGEARSAIQRLLGRVFLEPGEEARAIFKEQFREIGRRFGAALRRALPELPRIELLWRMHFAIGVMVFTLAGRPALEAISGGLCNPDDAEGVLGRMIAFVSAGLRAPVPATRRRRKACRGRRA